MIDSVSRITADQVDHANASGRTPVVGEKDHTVPPAIANPSYNKQKDNEGVTEIVEMPGRGHALVIDNAWREVADKALAFVKRFTPATRPA